MARNRTATKRDNHRTYLKNDASFHPATDERGRPADVPPKIPGAFGLERSAVLPGSQAQTQTLPDNGQKNLSWYQRVRTLITQWVS